MSSSFDKFAFPRFLGSAGHVNALEDSKSKIVYRDLKSLSSFGGRIVYRTMPFDLKPFSLPDN